MPKGPRGEKRPADVVGAAVKVMKIATGEIEEDIDDNGKDKAAVELGRKGGKARAKNLPAKRRSEIARAAAEERWNKRKIDCGVRQARRRKGLRARRCPTQEVTDFCGGQRFQKGQVEF